MGEDFKLKLAEVWIKFQIDNAELLLQAKAQVEAKNAITSLEIWMYWLPFSILLIVLGCLWQKRQPGGPSPLLLILGGVGAIMSVLVLIANRETISTFSLLG